jgi:uncharacterized protein
MGNSASCITDVPTLFLHQNQIVEKSKTASTSVLSANQELKIYRQLKNSFMDMSRHSLPLEEIASHILAQHKALEELYTCKSFTCPKVRFGRTGLQMPIITLGGMRQQLTWAPKEGTTLDDIPKDCQTNFSDIIERAMELGINHFETARFYGTSELQYGPLLKKYQRDSYILQTKVPPKENAEDFLVMLKKSFTELQLLEETDYVDLLSFHGLNRPEHLDWILKPGGCMEVIRDWQKQGKIKHVGFSTHGMTPLIVQSIETGQFDYVNLHYQFIGSYTATGSGSSGSGGNLDAIVAAQKQDMGVFIISATDKGGALYEPPQKLFRACLPLTPIAFNNLWLWSHQPSIHTLVVGASRPSDLDEHLEAAMQYGKASETLAAVTKRLYAMAEDRSVVPWTGDSSESFLDNWYKGLPTAYENDEGLPIGNLYWLWFICRAWGLYGFALKVNGKKIERGGEKTFLDDIPMKIYIQNKRMSDNS